MKKVEVNKDACIACGLCVRTDPAHFDFDEDGLSTAISQENLDTEDLEVAASSCPTGAILVHDGCDCGKECHCENDCHCSEE